MSCLRLNLADVVLILTRLRPFSNFPPSGTPTSSSRTARTSPPRSRRLSGPSTTCSTRARSCVRISTRRSDGTRISSSLVGGGGRGQCFLDVCNRALPHPPAIRPPERTVWLTRSRIAAVAPRSRADWGTSMWSAAQIAAAHAVAGRLHLVGPCAEQPEYGTFRLNFHRFDRFELDLRGRTQP